MPKLNAPKIGFSSPDIERAFRLLLVCSDPAERMKELDEINKATKEKNEAAERVALAKDIVKAHAEAKKLQDAAGKALEAAEKTEKRAAQDALDLRARVAADLVKEKGDTLERLAQARREIAELRQEHIDKTEEIKRVTRALDERERALADREVRVAEREKAAIARLQDAEATIQRVRSAANAG